MICKTLAVVNLLAIPAIAFTYNRHPSLKQLEQSEQQLDLRPVSSFDHTSGMVAALMSVGVLVGVVGLISYNRLKNSNTPSKTPELFNGSSTPPPFESLNVKSKPKSKNNKKSSSLPRITVVGETNNDITGNAIVVESKNEMMNANQSPASSFQNANGLEFDEEYEQQLAQMMKSWKRAPKVKVQLSAENRKKIAAISINNH